MAYVTVDEMRDAGVPAGISDDAIRAALDQWQGYIERETRQWFEPRTVTADIDGSDGPLLHLPVPIITLDSLYMNDDMDNVVDAALYRVHNKRAIPDNRRNPKIELISSRPGIYDLWRSAGNRPAFVKGTVTRLVGSFGYVDDAVDENDDPILVTPPMIKRALMKLAVKQLKAGNGSLWEEAGASLPASNRVTSETTDGHTISYDAARVQSARVATNSATGDAEVDRILALYKGPPIVATTGTFRLNFG